MAASDGMCLRIGVSGLICKCAVLKRLRGDMVHC